MIIPEHSSSFTREQLQGALEDVQHRLGINDENENQIERTTHRERLLEQQDMLVEALSSLDTPSNSSPSTDSTS
jgi:hypothetical protein